MLITVVLTNGRVLVAPRRAFADDDAAAAFRREVERLSGKQGVSVPGAP